MSTLTPEALAEALAALPGWRFDAERSGIAASFVFRDFAESFAWMTRVALLAEKVDHHPEWSNIWNKVHLLMTTHDAGGVTRKDIDFASAIARWTE